jgi:hypothetical protein
MATLAVPLPLQWNPFEWLRGLPPFAGSQGSSIIRDAGGSYFMAVDPTDLQISTAREVYLAGRSYTLTSQQVTDLTAAGYGGLIT